MKKNGGLVFGIGIENVPNGTFFQHDEYEWLVDINIYKCIPTCIVVYTRIIQFI